MDKHTVKIPFKKKLIWLFMVTNLLTLVVSLGAFWVYDYVYSKQSHYKKYELIVDLMDESIVKSINYRTTAELKENAQHLVEDKGILEFAIFDPQGKAFFGLPQTLNMNLKAYKKANPNDLFIRPLHSGNKLAGFVVLKPDNRYLYQDIYAAVVLGFIVAFLITLFTFFLSRKLAKAATLPIIQLTETAKKIARKKDFNLRVQKISDDEFGVLTDAFNTMLKEIQELQDAHGLQLEMSDDSYNKLKFLLDKTEQTKKRLEEEAVQRLNTANHLRTVRNHLDDIINSMPSILICVDKEGNVQEWNDAAVRFSKLTSEQTHDKPLIEVLPILAPKIDKVMASIENSQTNHIEKFCVQVDDKEFFFDILIYPLTKVEDKGAVIRLDDVTTQVRMENMMVQTEKMMSVGGLAAGMAHEINNPLGGILQSAQNLVRRIDPNLPKNVQEAEELGTKIEQVHQYLENRGILKFVAGIQDSGERAAQIVRNMLQFSRKNDDAFFNKADINQILDRSIALAANDYDLKKSYDFRQITVEKDYELNLPFVACVSSELEQVVLNLLRNAAQAMHEHSCNKKPTITVKTYMDKDFAYIDIADNGPGMDKEHLSRVFEPFFTTKEVGVGTGLGLSVSYFIIESKHQGKMSVSSEVGVGTTFTLCLPFEHIEKQDLTGTDA